MKNEYVIYRIVFNDGRFYIGKAKNFPNRKRGHLTNCRIKTTLKDITLFTTPYRFEIVDIAPSEYSIEQKQRWMDFKEKVYIHEEAKKTYNELTGLTTNYSNYTPYKSIINKKMVNTQLY